MKRCERCAAEKPKRRCLSCQAEFAADGSSLYCGHCRGVVRRHRLPRPTRRRGR